MVERPVRTLCVFGLLAALSGCGPGSRTLPSVVPATARSATYSRKVQGTSAAAAGLRCETPNGKLVVAPASDGKISFEAEVIASGNYPTATLKQWADQVTVTASTMKQLVVIEPALPTGRPQDVSLFIILSLWVPPKVALELKTASGAVDVTGIQASVTAESGNGDGRLQKIGSAVTASTQSGGITVRDVAGNLKVDSGNGDLTLEAIRGTVNAHTSSGRISATRVDGRLEAESGNGDVELSDVRWPARAHTASGRIHAERVTAVGKEVALSTGNGDVSFAGRAGDLTAETQSGAVQAELPALPHRTKLTSGNGAVGCRVPKGADVDLEASTSNGTVDLGPLAARGKATSSSDGPGPAEWSGRVGTGGPALEAHTANGSVRISEP